jgi:large subunit ribosomal protein L35
MPKMKTNKSAAKRFKRTASGKLKRFKAYRNHILTKKTTKRKRNLRRNAIAHESDMKRLNVLLPY